MITMSKPTAVPGKYYDYGPILSYNAVLNYIVGGRGIGKSYGAKKLVIDKYLKSGDQFMYVRRFKEELKKSRDQFFEDIADQYPHHIFRIEGNKAQIARKTDAKASWQDMGYFAALSVVQSLKSVPFPKVKRIIYDEFIPERGATRELPSEPDILLNLLNTVDRHQDKTQVFLLANAVSIMSPHLLQYDIEPTPGRIAKYGGGLIVADFPSSDAYNAAVAHTRTARLFALNEQYNDYAANNEFADNAPTMLAAKPSAAKYKWSLEVSKGTFSVWREDMSNHYYVQEKRPKDERVLTIIAANMDHDKMFQTYADLPLASMRTAFRHGRMSFDKPTTRNAITEIFKR